MKYFIPAIFIILFQCCKNNETEKGERIAQKIQYDSLTLKIHIAVDPFKAYFFKALDSIGFRIRKYKTLNGDSIKERKLDRLFLYNFRNTYTDSIFRETIIERTEYFITKRKEDDLESIYQQLFIFHETILKDTIDLRSAKNKYDGLLNYVFSDSKKTFSRTYYDFKNKKIWFLRGSKPGASDDLIWLIKIMKLAEIETEKFEKSKLK